MLAGTPLLVQREQMTLREMKDAPPHSRRKNLLVGQLHAIRFLLDNTRWDGVRAPGDDSKCDAAWNKGLDEAREGSGAGAAGRFCAFCACRSQPLLARHRMVDCERRMLCAEWDFSPSARSRLEEELAQTEALNSAELDKHRTLIAQRGVAQSELRLSQYAIKFLRRCEAPIDSVEAPRMTPPRRLAPICRPVPPGYGKQVRDVCTEVLRQSEQSIAKGARSGVWREIKALLGSAPRPSLLLDAAASGEADGERRLWAVAAVVNPMTIRKTAAALGASLLPADGEYFLLPLVIACIQAPLPPGWREVARGGALLFEHAESGAVQELHPLASAFQRRMAFERRRVAKAAATDAEGLLQREADRWVQFVDEKGAAYFYDFSTGARLRSLSQLVEQLLQKVPNAERPPPPSPPKQPRGEHGRESMFMNMEDAAAAAALAASQSPARSTQDGAASGAPAPLKRRLSSAIETTVAMVRLQSMNESRQDAEWRSECLGKLHSLYHRAMAAAVVQSPRPLNQTLEVARAYGISLHAEPDSVWLADLALSLPPAAGWLWIELSAQQGRSYWYNELTGSRSTSTPSTTT